MQTVRLVRPYTQLWRRMMDRIARTNRNTNRPFRSESQMENTSRASPAADASFMFDRAWKCLISDVCPAANDVYHQAAVRPATRSIRMS